MNTLRPYTAAAAALALLLSLHGASARTWKEGSTGRTLEGDFVSLSGDQVEIKTKAGRTIRIALEKLSEEDRQYATTTAAEKKKGSLPFGDDKKAPGASAAGGTWGTDYEAALAVAKAEKKTVVLDFTGSDWCGWCIKLKGEVFDHKEFKEYAAANLVLVELDYPQAKKLPRKEAAQNEKLKDEYKIKGYPTIILLNSEGKEFARTGYKEGGPEAYVKHLEALIGSAAEEAPEP